MKNFKKYQESLQLCKFLQIILSPLQKWLNAMTVNCEAMATLCYVRPVYLFMPVKGLARTCIHFCTLFKQYLCTHEVLNKTYKYNLLAFFFLTFFGLKKCLTFKLSSFSHTPMNIYSDLTEGRVYMLTKVKKLLKILIPVL